MVIRSIYKKRRPKHPHFANPLLGTISPRTLLLVPVTWNTAQVRPNLRYVYLYNYVYVYGPTTSQPPQAPSPAVPTDRPLCRQVYNTRSIIIIRSSAMAAVADMILFMVFDLI